MGRLIDLLHRWTARLYALSAEINFRTEKEK